MLPQDNEALFTLSCWDLILHIMMPTVYHNPLKLFVLSQEHPLFYVNITIPLLSDKTLWLLGFSSFAKALLQYDTVPAFLKTLVQDVQALVPTSDGQLTPYLHF